jgi:hypothetical protein
MKLVITVALCVATLHLPARAANWVDVAGNDEVTVLVDTESVRKSGTRVKTWLKWKWQKPQDVPSAYPVKTYQSEKQLQVSDCKNGTLAIAQGIRYAGPDDGDVVDSYTIEERAWKFSEAAPETIGETLIKFACKSPPPKRK